MNNRGMKKWAPFNSLVNTNKMKKDISKSKNVIKMPILSEDQLEKIENTIKEAYYDKDYIYIEYYFNNAIINKKCKIKFIDYNKKQIILSDNTILFHKQIVNVKNI